MDGSPAVETLLRTVYDGDCAGIAEQLDAHGPELVHARGSDGRRPTHVAASANQPLALALLLNRGADLEGRDANDRTPLHHAIVWHGLDCAGLLLVRGAAVNALDGEGWTPLHWAW